MTTLPRSLTSCAILKVWYPPSQEVQAYVEVFIPEECTTWSKRLLFTENLESLVDSFKARLARLGFSKVETFDFEKTSSPAHLVYEFWVKPEASLIRLNPSSQEDR